MVKNLCILCIILLLQNRIFSKKIFVVGLIFKNFSGVLPLGMLNFSEQYLLSLALFFSLYILLSIYIFYI